MFLPSCASNDIEEPLYNAFLRTGQNSSAIACPIDTPTEFEFIDAVVSRLDNSPVVCIAGKSGDTLSLYFYSITNGLSKDCVPAIWNDQFDHVTVEGNRIAIAGASDLEVYPGKAPVLFQIESDTEYCYAVIHKYEHYTKDKNYSLELVPGSWALQMAEEQYSILYDVYDSYPFDESIPLLLEQNTEILAQKPWRLPLPEGYEYFGMCKGDLNGDGLEDIAVVIEQRPGMLKGSRMIYVMLAREGGSFAVCWQNGSQLLGRGEGGDFAGGPYCGININNGELLISQYVCRFDYWGFSYTYAMRNGELVLTHFSKTSCEGRTTCGTITTYDVLTGIVEERSRTDRGNLFDGLLLSAYSVAPEQVFLFADESYGQWNIPLPDHYDANPPLPSLGGVQYGEPTWIKSMLSASQALDIVMSSLYPSSTKHYYTHSEEIMDNYKTLLCYDIPPYYYTDGDTTLTYRNQTALERGQFHYILVQTPDDARGYSVEVNDLTGMIDE